MADPSPSWSQERYLAALRFAAERHEGQTVPGTSLPYLMHVTSVAMEVMGALGVESVSDPDTAVQCALLHDVVEDTPTTVEEVIARFGPTVAAGVDALSKRASAGPTKAERMADSLERIRLQPHEVWMVKLADRITNLQRPPAHWSQDKCTKYRAEAVTILEVLSPASPYLARRLQAKIRDYAPYTALA